MKIITFQDILLSNVKSEICYSWAEELIKNKDKTILPPKISLKPFDGTFCNFMPSILSGVNQKSWGGVKVVTRYPDRIPSLESCILLMDAETGEFLALMDGTWITTMRTGAVAAHSVMLFAKKNFATIGMMGLGNVSRSTMLFLSEKATDRELHIKLLKYKGQEESFAERFKANRNLHFSYVDTPEEMVGGSDVVISGATYLPYDVCEDRYFSEGVLVQPIHTLGFTNCDFFFDKVYADDLKHIQHFRNYDKFKTISEVSDVVKGIKKGRESDSERILVYNIGISIHDINFAAKIYQMMKGQGLLDELPDADLKEPSEKFWV